MGFYPGAVKYHPILVEDLYKIATFKNRITQVIFNVLQRNKQNIIYALSLAALLLLLKWLEWRFVIIDHALEIYAGSIAVVFTAFGIWLAIKLITSKVKTVVVEKQVFTGPGFVLNQEQADSLRLSNRELEVLRLIANGLSNQQIAERLFVSLNTIKTHTSNLFLKLEVERRTQAIEKAKRLSLIP